MIMISPSLLFLGEQMRLPAVLFVTFFAVTGSACSSNSTPVPLPIQPTDSPERIAEIAASLSLQIGEQVYIRQCAHCHG